MGKEKKKSDWDNLSEMLSQDADAPQNADDWGAVEPSTAPAAEVEVEVETETEPEAENAAKAPAKTKRACGEKKAKATKTRKKAAPKTDKIDAALAAPVADASQDAETLDLTVAETEKAPKKRRRTTKKTEQDETELVKNVLKLEKETKAKKRARAKTAEVNPFVGLLSQIERVAQDDPTDAATPEPVAAVEPTETLEPASPTTENVESENFFADFFADSNVEELEISWGRPQVDETEAQAEPEIAAEPEVAPEPVAEPETETSVEAEVETAPRRRERRRRRRDDRAPREEADAEIAALPIDDVKTDVDLNDLEAFFATDSEDEGVGFAPRRESKKVEKAEKVEKIVVAAETPADDAFESDEDDEARSKRKRRRRRGGRRPFEDEADAPTLDGEAESESVDETEEETETYEPERAPRERRRRERRPRREREFDAETTENTAETFDERRAGAPERVLPSWSDAISHVVRFNMSRRVNRRR